MDQDIDGQILLHDNDKNNLIHNDLLVKAMHAPKIVRKINLMFIKINDIAVAGTDGKPSEKKGFCFFCGLYCFRFNVFLLIFLSSFQHCKLIYSPILSCFIIAQFQIKLSHEMTPISY